MDLKSNEFISKTDQKGRIVVRKSLRDLHGWYSGTILLISARELTAKEQAEYDVLNSRGLVDDFKKGVIIE